MAALSLDRAALLRAIVTDPADDLPRLAYADLCDEAGEPDRAEFIRTQIELAGRVILVCRHGRALRGYASFTKRCRCEACSLKRREYLSSRQHINVNWARAGVRGVYADPGDFRRGFIAHVTCTPAAWTSHGPALILAYPLTSVTLRTSANWRVVRDDDPVRSAARVAWARRAAGLPDLEATS